MDVATLSDLKNETSRAFRLPIAPSVSGYQPRPLIPETEVFAFPWLNRWHATQHNWQPSDVACYSVLNAVISGAGNIWIDDRLVTSPEVMPAYVANVLQIASGGSDSLKREHSLPVRTVDRPCLVAVGHGIRVYGHFVIEMLFRILVARRAYGGMKFRSGVLLDTQAPDWLLTILKNDLGIPAGDLEFFDSSREQVRLKHAIVPGRVFIRDQIHPIANDLLDEFLHHIEIPASFRKRVFVARRNFSNPAAPHRICSNEASLVEIAKIDHGFEPVVPEDLTWREQIALFRDAEIILGQAGSALHTALFSRSDSRLASIGFMNLTQAEIAILRQQETAYFSEGVRLSGAFTIEEIAFRRFLRAVCSVY